MLGSLSDTSSMMLDDARCVSVAFWALTVFTLPDLSARPCKLRLHSTRRSGCPAPDIGSAIFPQWGSVHFPWLSWKSIIISQRKSSKSSKNGKEHGNQKRKGDTISWLHLVTSQTCHPRLARCLKPSVPFTLRSMTRMPPIPLSPSRHHSVLVLHRTDQQVALQLLLHFHQPLEARRIARE